VPITASKIESLIKAALPDAQIEVADTTGGGDHWSATVVAASFQGKSLVDRHRAVYAALGDLMRGEIHALALDTRTPEERRRT
jgi:stress-induced morphogen